MVGKTDKSEGPGSGIDNDSDNDDFPGNYSLFPQSDIVFPGFWINGTRLALLQGYGAPNILDSSPNKFPFKRLAQVTPSESSITYLYHQMNSTTFSEEQFDYGLYQWLPPTYFTVADD